jgi:hypothetical protein
MGSRKIYIINNSNHPLEYVSNWGTSIGEIQSGTIISPGSQKFEIGHIDIPCITQGSDNHGWWHIRDPINMATFELYAQVDHKSKKDDSVSIGLLANCNHATKNPAPNPCPCYLECCIDKNDNDSFKFTIKSTWTDNPPSYIFNYGHYEIKEILGQEAAVHSFIVVQSFNGDKKITFKCWGGDGTKPDEKEDLRFPAMTFLGGEYELALARTICCFDPYDQRDDYDHHSEGKLILGDCCGIIYGQTGVCHQMANRICAAVTDVDVGDRANMASYNLTHEIYGTYGGGSPLQYAPPAIIKLIWDDFITDEELKKLGIPPDSPLYYPWDKYFEECKKLVSTVQKENNNIKQVNNYTAQVQWGGSSAPWNQDGTWVMGSRENQRVVKVNIESKDGGQTFSGEINYKGEGSIGFKATYMQVNNYTAQVQWGGSSTPWNQDGTWVMGSRENQRVVKVNIESKDGGKTFSGEITYKGEGPIGFKGELL